MFIHGDTVAVPELLDTILSHLGPADRHACTFVNRQFHLQAVQLLNKEIRRNTDPDERPRIHLMTKFYIAQCVCKHPTLAAYVKELSIFNSYGLIPENLLRLSFMRYRSNTVGKYKDLSKIFRYCPLKQLSYTPPLFESLPPNFRYLHCVFRLEGQYFHFLKGHG